MFKGTSASAGIGIGKAVIVEEAELVITRNEVADAEAEIQRFKGALEKTIAATQKMADDLASRVGEKEAEIMQGHMMLLSDPMLTGEIENSVKNDKVNCEFAIENVCNMYADMFASMGDELMQQRATDMRDIKVRMQRTLMGLESVDVSLLPKGSILVAKDLTPSMTAGINPENVSGIVTELGGKTSHSAILARALEIPAVVAVNGLIAHSNHIRHPHYAYQVDALGGTLYRDRRILKHLQPKAGAVTMEDIKDAFKDHFGYPFSVCRHGDSRKTELNRISTLGCILMDVTDRRIWVCKGTPCCGEFKEYMWERPHKKSDWDQIEKW